jgi:ankyrin repeat protein
MNRIDQELLEAVKRNNAPEVGRLLSVGAHANAKNNAGFAALIVASNQGHDQVVVELLKHGAYIEATDSDGWTPLHWACLKGHLAVVIELRGHGADIEAKEFNSCTPLHCACLMGRVSIVNELRSPGAEIHANDGNALTTSILGKRKSRGADIDAKNNIGETPLHWASEEGHLPVVKALLSGGANLLAANNDGELPIHQAMREGHSAVSKCLLQHFYATTRRLPLHELVEDLPWIGDPDSMDAPPLRSALDLNVLGTEDVVEIVEYLLGQNPALLSSRDQDGSLPLHVACRRGVSFTIVQSLVNHDKASVKSVTSEGDLPLFLACDVPEPSLDTIFMLMKLYPDLVYR